jgi:hypothetical protein
MGVAIKRQCDECGKTYTAKSPRSKFCRPACRSRAHEKRAVAAVVDEIQVGAPVEGGIAEATIGELERLRKQDSPMGRVAVALARRIDAGEDVGSSMAAAAKELRAILESLAAQAPQAADPVTKLRVVRDDVRRPRRGA